MTEATLVYWVRLVLQETLALKEWPECLVPLGQKVTVHHDEEFPHRGLGRLHVDMGQLCQGKTSTCLQAGAWRLLALEASDTGKTG